MRSLPPVGRALALLAVLLAGCTAGQPPPPVNVLLVTLDTTRPDRLGCYGDADAETPHLDRLAAEGVRFLEARSTAGLTPMAHASILTGLDPYAHGLRVFYGKLGHRLSPELPSLPRVLRERGWETAAFVSAYPVSQAYGFDAGFDTFRCGIEDTLDSLDLTHQQRHQRLWADARRSATQRRADDTIDDALGWLERRDGERPWCLWVHLFDVHDFSLVPPVDFARARGVEYDPSRRANDLAAREELYDLELAWMDAQLGRLFQRLRERGELERTIVVVTADHGQGLSDGVERHGWMLHRLLYEWSLRVPLILRLPGGEQGGRVVAAPVRVTDVFPTILERLDLPPPEGLQGASLLPLVAGLPSAPRVAYAEALNLEDAHAPLRRLPPGQQDDLFCLVEGRWKYVRHLRRPAESELYDLALDPGETTNLLEERPDVVRRLAALLEARGALRLEPAADGGPAPNAQALGDLGYTGEDPEGGAPEDGDAGEEDAGGERR